MAPTSDWWVREHWGRASETVALAPEVHGQSWSLLCRATCRPPSRTSSVPRDDLAANSLAAPQHPASAVRELDRAAARAVRAVQLAAHAAAARSSCMPCSPRAGGGSRGCRPRARPSGADQRRGRARRPACPRGVVPARAVEALEREALAAAVDVGRVHAERGERLSARGPSSTVPSGRSRSAPRSSRAR